MKIKKIFSLSNLILLLGILFVLVLSAFLYQPNFISSYIASIILKENNELAKIDYSKEENNSITLKGELTHINLNKILNPDNLDSNELIQKDPFQPHDLTPNKLVKSGDSKLETLTYDEMFLTAVVEGIEEPTAIIEDKTGHGYYVKIGTKVGNLGGVVTKIEKGKVTVEENTIEYDGKRQTRIIDILLRPNKEK